MKRLWMGCAAAAMVALSGFSAAAQEKVIYLFPAPSFLPAFAPFQLAKAKGYFRDAGLEVDFQVGKGGADVATQVAVGNADLGGGIGDTPIIVRANGLEVRGVALLGGRGLTQLYWRKDSGIKGPADLKGKKIGVLAFQDTTYYNLLGALASQGMTKADVDAQAVGAAGMIQLMISGDVQAISGVPEWGAAIRAAGVELGEKSVDELFPAMAQAIIASDKTIAKRPNVVRGFVKAVLKAIDDIEADPAKAAKEYVAAVPQHAGKEAMIEGVMRSYVSLVYPAAKGQKRGTFDAERIKKVQAFYVSNGLVQNAVPVNDLFTNAFVAN